MCSVLMQNVVRDPCLAAAAAFLFLFEKEERLCACVTAIGNSLGRVLNEECPKEKHVSLFERNCDLSVSIHSFNTKEI